MSREKQIRTILKDMGISTATLGYKLVTEAILIFVENEFNVPMKVVYSKLATKYKTTSSRAERNIRFSIEKMNERETEFYKKVICTTNTKPTNSEFISSVADYIEMSELI